MARPMIDKDKCIDFFKRKGFSKETIKEGAKTFIVTEKQLEKFIYNHGIKKIVAGDKLEPKEKTTGKIKKDADVKIHTPVDKKKSDKILQPFYLKGQVGVYRLEGDFIKIVTNNSTSINILKKDVGRFIDELLELSTDWCGNHD